MNLGRCACWGVFALLLNKLYINNRKIEYLLLFGLISTLSMAYFIQVALYFYLFYRDHRKKIILPAIFFLLMLKGLASLSDGIDSAIFGRFAVDERTGSLVGDNRSELIVRCWRIFTTAPIAGVGATYLATVVSAKEGFVGANIFTNWASDGILGVIITYIPILVLLKLGQTQT